MVIEGGAPPGPRRALRAVWAAIALVLGACSGSSPPPPAKLDLTAAQWGQDLDVFARELPRRHASAFHFISRPSFEAEIADLRAQLPNLNDDEVFVGFAHIAKLIGDGHTAVRFPPNRPGLPLKVAAFGDDHRIVAVAPGYETALGARILAIDGMPIDEVEVRLLTLTPYDETPALRQLLADGLLAEPLALHGMGITGENQKPTFILEQDGGAPFALSVAETPRADPDTPRAIPIKAPLSAQYPGRDFWCVWLPRHRTVYCDFRRYDNLWLTSHRLFGLIGRHKPAKVVIDLRDNGGGDYNVGLAHLVRPLARDTAINQRGHLFVLIGVRTFSAAMSNASHFRRMTRAILVGDPIGEKPDSYQENRHFSLPHSHLMVSVSTRFYSFANGPENLIRPDQETPTTWADFQASRDPALAWALAYGPTD